ncbi:hypothetical protein ACTHGU_18745 [Chitinophagaceae bacterium MMS25-I14]
MIKVGFCVAYDWHLLAYSVPLIYKDADTICLSLDKDRKSWAGNNFSWNEQGFQAMLQDLDPDGKIRLLEEDFHLSTLKPMENEVRQRKMMADVMGEGGWHIQLDADEYFLHFDRFTDFLRSQTTSRKVNIWCPYITLFKQVNEGFLSISHTDFYSSDGNPIATNAPAYQHGRVSGWFNIKAPFYIIHQSWARPQEEITEKINNWGHKNDFNTVEFLEWWKKLDADNYKTARNFHPIVPALWPTLELIPGASIKELIKSMDSHRLPLPSKYKLMKENSIWLSRLRKLLKK